jgi:hypothetical protein
MECGMRLLSLLVLLVLTSSCTRSSGVLKVAPEIFTISASSGGVNGVRARQLALSEAAEYCTKLGKEIVVTNEANRPTDIEVTFRCIARGN